MGDDVVEGERWCEDWGFGNNTWKLRNENNGIVESNNKVWELIWSRVEKILIVDLLKIHDYELENYRLVKIKTWNDV